MNYEKEKIEERKIAKVIKLAIIEKGLIVICFALMIVTIIYRAQKVETLMESYFVEYDNMTLIKATSSIKNKHDIYITEYIGFIDNNIYEKYKNGEYEGIVEIYHPYTQGKSIIVNTENFQSVKKLSHIECYKEYPPIININKSNKKQLKVSCFCLMLQC